MRLLAIESIAITLLPPSDIRSACCVMPPVHAHWLPKC